jgi:hypothetical protein
MRAYSFIWSFAACTLTTLGFLATSEELRHWFIVPVLLCGILIGADAVDWLRRLDPFDPAGLLGLLGVHFFFLAPLLHVACDHWMDEVITPADWRDWLGRMAWLNAAGMLVYFLVRDGAPAHDKRAREGGGWSLDRQRFFVLVIAGLLVSGALQVWVYARYGGILGYIEKALDYVDRVRMQGMGSVFMISESFPILALLCFAVYARQGQARRSWPVLLGVLLTFFALQMLFGGLRGSRSNTVWALFWAVGIIHLWLRPVSRWILVVGGSFLVLFLYLYGLYKAAGLDAVDTFADPSAQAVLAEKTHRNFETLLLGDLGRSDVQALILERLTDPESDYHYALGRTYLGAVALLVPKALWPDRPPAKVLVGTEVLYGRGSYREQDCESSRVYGLAGEPMLNFGPAAVPLSFALLGVAVRRLRAFLAALPEADPRRLLSPFLIILCSSALSSDSDNLLFSLWKDGPIPFAIVWFCSVPNERRKDSERMKDAG